MADEKMLHEEAVELIELSDGELDEAAGGAMIKPSNRMRAVCHACCYTFYPLVPIGQKPRGYSCPQCRSTNVGVTGF